VALRSAMWSCLCSAAEDLPRRAVSRQPLAHRRSAGGGPALTPGHARCLRLLAAPAPSGYGRVSTTCRALWPPPIPSLAFRPKPYSEGPRHTSHLRPANALHRPALYFDARSALVRRRRRRATLIFLSATLSSSSARALPDDQLWRRSSPRPAISRSRRQVRGVPGQRAAIMLVRAFEAWLLDR